MRRFVPGRRHVWVWALGLLACVAPRGGTLHPAYAPHARGGLTTIEDFDALSRGEPGGLRSVKFIITDFDTPERARALFLDGHFYKFHDEWHWYQLLNGGSVYGDAALDDSPGFSSPAEAEAWFRMGHADGLELRYVGGDERLYSSYFYELSLSEPRRFGLGALIHVPASDDHPALWGFTLEYTDRPDAEIVEHFRAALQRQLPQEVAADLRWVTRSPPQARLAADLERVPGWKGRTLPYSALSRPGEIQTYHAGVGAGRLRLVQAGTPLSRSEAHDILVVEALPDRLPPCAGLITTVPHTPLSHLNLLARNRGIPSVYVGGLADNAYFMQLARARAPVMLSAEAGRVRVVELSEAELDRWVRGEVRTLRIHPAPDPMSIPLTVALDTDTRPTLEVVGGKSMGLSLLARTGGLSLPAPRLAISVQAYARHIAPLRERVETLLSLPDFTAYRQAQVLALEGRAAFADRFPDRRDRVAAAAIEKRSPLIATLADAGGLRRMIRQLPLDPRLEAELGAALRAHFGALPVTQGLRFRSSSTVEDVAGFNGAGLYVSSTGFLDPLAQPSKRDQRRSVAWALRRTWASYWGWEAYEERQQAGMDHLSGRMGVLVHPRFDDAQELANGVITFELDLERRHAEMVVNAQAGALSVTNPPTAQEVVPEVVRLVRVGDGPRSLRREQASSVADGAAVMGDGELEHLFSDVRRVAEAWLSERNAALPPARHGARVTLDLEFRTMAGAWPDGDAGRGPRVVLKQVRPLAPAPPLPELGALELPIPEHLALRAERAVEVDCRGGGAHVRFMEVHVPGRDAPFVPFLQWDAGDAQPRLTHLEFSQPQGGVFSLAADAAARHGRAQVELGGMRCERRTELVARAALLRSLQSEAIDLGARGDAE